MPSSSLPIVEIHLVFMGKVSGKHDDFHVVREQHKGLGRRSVRDRC